MTANEKRKALMLFVLVLTATLLIAVSLPRLELQAGLPLPSLENNLLVIEPAAAEPVMAISITNFFAVLFTLILAVIILVTFYKLLRGANWKSIADFIRLTFVICLVVFAITFIIMLLPNSRSPLPVEEFKVPISTPPATSPLGSVPPLLLWLVGIALLVSGILIGVWMFRLQTGQATTLDLLGLEAEKAWHALKTGLDMKDVIIKCYQQMSMVLEKERGLERKDSMTTREFEQLLESAGVPHDPIHELTRLFEAVRYGRWQPNPLDEQKAIRCLEAIILSARQSQDKE